MPRKQLKFLIFSAITIPISALVVWAQQAKPANDSRQREDDTIGLRLRVQRPAVGLDDQIVAFLTVTNKSHQETCLSTGAPYKIHVERNHSEPGKTEYHRHLLGDFRLGDTSPELPSGPVICASIEPGGSIVKKYDISAYYDVKAPGSYTVYIELFDDPVPTPGSGTWLRSNEAAFVVK